MVAFGNEKKGSLDVQMLLQEVKNAFGIRSQGCSYFIQKFYQDWNEWVDVTDASSLVNRDKLKLIKANHEVIEEENSTTAKRSSSSASKSGIVA
ncbi:unnamed protein product [Porites evermanni]|uniref:Uncharacterized protein n=1 Tax=Porites evermanni TaxID=104178 RepID=A0ABN8PF56_9CNID|nr:unnamed protein product [Porites evermanni]